MNTINRTVSELVRLVFASQLRVNSKLLFGPCLFFPEYLKIESLKAYGIWRIYMFALPRKMGSHQFSKKGPDSLFFLSSLLTRKVKLEKWFDGREAPVNTFQNDSLAVKSVLKSYEKTRQGSFKKRLYNVLLCPQTMAVKPLKMLDMERCSLRIAWESQVWNGVHNKFPLLRKAYGKDRHMDVCVLVCWGCPNEASETRWIK